MIGSLHMGWRHVLFANWPVDPAAVETHLPKALTLDTYDGRAWLSVVPFTNVDVRPRLLPSGAGLPLPELNLRTYVTYDGTPGVYFFSLDADGLLAVLGARLFHHLPYYYATIDLRTVNGRIRFANRRRHPGARPVQFDATYGPVGDRYAAEPDTLARFLTARYRYYTEAPDGTLRYATIDHDPWPLYDADVEIETNTLFRANGFATPDSDPVHFYSPGVETIASESIRTGDSERADSNAR
ncbi:YqjF family protein [Natronorubrum sp. FCH18a]|uniref:YqjF family protein n=1 Tax=Natronorubrum sp. FCH18a TaxID=3447018 RepID=UPI003F517FC3